VSRTLGWIVGRPKKSDEILQRGRLFLDKESLMISVSAPGHLKIAHFF
jgi:hypothetical protein